jgi:surface antigen
MRLFNASGFRSRRGRVAGALLLAALLAGCAGHPGGYRPGPRAVLGGAAGAAAGGLLGSAASDGDGAAIAAGVLLGGLLGGALGDALDQHDRRQAARSFHRGLEYHRSGHASTWHNPDSGHRGSFTPTRTWETADGYCREFTETVTIEGRQQRAHGTACRDADGSWRIVGL